MEKEEETPHHHNGITNYFQGATIHNLVINGDMNRSGTENYYGERQQEKREATLEDVVAAIRQRSLVATSLASITVVYAVCRDVYKWSMGQAEFERYMTLQGINCPPGTIANTMYHNPYMRDNVSKWGIMGAKQDVLKLRDEVEKAIEEQIQTTPGAMK